MAVDEEMQVCTAFGVADEVAVYQDYGSFWQYERFLDEWSIFFEFGRTATTGILALLAAKTA